MLPNGYASVGLAMRDLSKRVATLEPGTVGAVTLRDAIDRPPRETPGAIRWARRATSGSPVATVNFQACFQSTEGNYHDCRPLETRTTILRVGD
jgi:hypothetical protein